MTDHSSSHQSFYADASVYDILHAKGTADEVDALERIEREHAPGAPSVWLEPACGSGRLLRLAAKRSPDRRVIGFDREEGMIAYAERRAKAARLAARHELFAADMTHFADFVKPSSVGLALNPINTIRHLESDDELREHFAQIARVLHPRGVYAVGLSLSLEGCEFPSEDVWEGRRGPVAVKQVVGYIPPEVDTGLRAEMVYSHMTVTTPTATREIASTYALRTYSLGQWLAAIDRSPLRVTAFTDMLGVPDEPAETGYGLWILARR